MTLAMLHPQGTAPPPPSLYMYGLRAAQNGRFLGHFFVTEYCDRFFDQGVGVGVEGPGRTHPLSYIHPW